MSLEMTEFREGERLHGKFVYLFHKLIVHI